MRRKLDPIAGRGACQKYCGQMSAIDPKATFANDSYKDSKRYG